MSKYNYRSSSNFHHTPPYILRQQAFVGSPVRNQPQKPLYKARPYPKPWFQQGLTQFATGAIGYVSLANRIGWGFNEPGLDYANLSRPFSWIFPDRSNWKMWL